MKTNIPFSSLLWFALLSMLGFLATDMYLPAFETIRNEMETTQSLIGLSLSLFLLGMALGQLIYGPLSDRYGRIRVLVGGLALFTIATVATSVSASIEVFLAARFLQALGACSATVIWQAVVIDRYDSSTGQRVFATIMPLVALSPALAPLAGAFLEAHLGWRSIFFTLIAIGVALIAMTLRQEESNKNLSKDSNPIEDIKKNYSVVLKSKKFIGNMMIFAGCSAAFFAWLTGSPFVMTEMGYSGADIGLSYVPQTIAFILGGYGCRSLLGRYEGTAILPWLLKLFVLSIVVMFAITWQFNPTVIWPVLIPFCLLAVANGAVYPIVVNQALEDFKQCSATAAGLLNFLQTMVCFLASGVVSALAANGLMTVMEVMMVCAATVIIGYTLTVMARREPELATQN